MTHLLKTGTLRTALLAVATLGIGLVSPARADLILFNPTGSATIGGFNPGTSQISSLNFGSGDSVSLGAVPIVPGSTFQLYYQTQLVALNGAQWTTPDPRRLGHRLPDHRSREHHRDGAIGANPSNGTALFTQAPVQAPGSGVKIYFEDLTASGAVRATPTLGWASTSGV